MIFDNLSENLRKAIKSLKGQDRITDINIASTLKAIKRSLVQADVNYKIVKQVTENIKQKSLGTNILTAVSPGQLFTKLVQDELTHLMGTTHQEICLSGHPAVILLAGLQGSGKTTLAAKLGLFYKNKNKHPCLVACDVYRPAAVEQLKILGQQHNIAVYAEPDEKDPLIIAKHAIQEAKKNAMDLVIVDTAGRLANDQVLMQELCSLKAQLNPSETLLVVDAMVGQDAINTAQLFNERLNFDGVVLTKLDGDARGGVALSIRSVIDKPIKLISTGERIQNLELFHPDRMASRILGMGHVVTLVERAEQLYNKEQYQKLSQKLKKNKFDFNDFLKQIQQINKLGSFKELVAMLPGFSDALSHLPIEDNPFKKYEVLINSMTPQERSNPDLLDKQRKERLVKGSGLSFQEVNLLLKQFGTMRKILKQYQQKGPGFFSYFTHMLKNMKKS